MNMKHSNPLERANPNDEAWAACLPGTLSGVVGAVRARRRAKMIGRVAASSAVVLFVVVGGTILSGRMFAPAEYDFGGVWCSEVRQVAESYMSGDLIKEDPELAQRVAKHVSLCPLCGKMIDRMRQEASVAVAFSHHGSDGIRCRDPNCRHHHSDNANPLLFFAQVDDPHRASR